MLQVVEDVTSQMLPYASEAVAKYVSDDPAVTEEPEGEITTLATAAGVTVIPVSEPVIELFDVSVAVIDSVPAVSKATVK